MARKNTASEVKPETASQQKEPAQADTADQDTKQATQKRSKAEESFLVRQFGPGVANLVFHTVLMAVVPFSIFFASINGVFDPVYRVTFGIPDDRNKAIPAALLAVLSVQFVIASFVIQAFKEDQQETKAKKSD